MDTNAELRQKRDELAKQYTNLSENEYHGCFPVANGYDGLMVSHGGVDYAWEYLTNDSYAFVFPKTDRGKHLRDELNRFLAGLKDDGTLEELENIWFGSDESKKTIEAFENLPSSNGTVDCPKPGNAFCVAWGSVVILWRTATNFPLCL